jgi:tetratricopeptide (TPR) repeat protein
MKGNEKKTTKRTLKKNPLKNYIITFFMPALLFTMSGSGFLFARGASHHVNEGNAAFHKGSLAEAAARYEDALEENPDSPVPLFNLGVVLYKQGNFSAALTAFQSIETTSGELGPLIHYNQGNALARIGKSEESENPQEALDNYFKSIAAYKRALAMDSGHIESAYNIEIVRTWIRDLNEKMGKTSGSGSSFDSLPEEKNEPKPGTSPGEQNEEQKDGQPEDSDGEGSSPPESSEIPSVPQDDSIVARDETAHAILQEEKQRREAEARIKGGLSADDKPTW